jgi:hypothetical protein
MEEDNDDDDALFGNVDLEAIVADERSSKPPVASKAHAPSAPVPESKPLTMYVSSKEVSSNPQLLSDLGDCGIRVVVVSLKVSDFECSTRLGVLRLSHKDLPLFLKGIMVPVHTHDSRFNQKCDHPSPCQAVSTSVCTA